MTDEPDDIEGDALPGPDEPPPFLGAWRNLYLLVLAELALLIVLFWLLTRRFQ